MVGQFSPGKAASGLLRLNANGDYVEFDWLVKIPEIVEGREQGFSVDALGPIDSGTWLYSEGVLILRSNRRNHEDRQFAVSFEETMTVLKLKGSKLVSYFMPNHSTEPTPASVTRPAEQAARQP